MTPSASFNQLAAPGGHIRADTSAGSTHPRSRRRHRHPQTRGRKTHPHEPWKPGEKPGLFFSEGPRLQRLKPSIPDVNTFVQQPASFTQVVLPGLKAPALAIHRPPSRYQNTLPPGPSQRGPTNNQTRNHGATTTRNTPPARPDRPNHQARTNPRRRRDGPHVGAEPSSISGPVRASITGHFGKTFRATSNHFFGHFGPDIKATSSQFFMPSRTSYPGYLMPFRASHPTPRSANPTHSSTAHQPQQAGPRILESSGECQGLIRDQRGPARGQDAGARTVSGAQ